MHGRTLERYRQLKLSSVLNGHADEALLDSYEPERIGFTRKPVATTDRVFTFATAQGPMADLLCTRLAPLLIPKALALAPVRKWLFRTMSQLTLNYRHSALSDGAAGHIHEGNLARLPGLARSPLGLRNTMPPPVDDL